MLWGEETYRCNEAGDYVYEVYFCGEVVYIYYGKPGMEQEWVQAMGRTNFAIDLKVSLTESGRCP